MGLAWTWVRRAVHALWPSSTSKGPGFLPDILDKGPGFCAWRVLYYVDKGPSARTRGELYSTLRNSDVICNLLVTYMVMPNINEAFA